MATTISARPMLNIEAARRQRGWSQHDLGHHPEVLIHQTFISQIERGVGLPVREQIERLARVLGVPADELLKPVGVPWKEGKAPEIGPLPHGDMRG